VAQAHYSFGGTNFGVRSTDRRFMELVDQYLGPLANPGGTAEHGSYSADLGVEKALPGGKVVRGKRSLYYETLTIYEGRDDHEMVARLVSFFRDRATQLASPFIRIRAASVAFENGAVLLPSLPEPHLPAIAGQLVRSGAGLLGDELVQLDPVLGNVHGTGLPMLIDTEDLVLFPELQRRPRRRRQPLALPDELRGATPRSPANSSELGGYSAESTALGWVVFPAFELGAVTRLEPVGSAEAVFRGSQALLNLHIWEERALAFLGRVVETIPVSRLIVGSLPEAASLLSTEAPRMMRAANA
jgi:hypothetical protein